MARARRWKIARGDIDNSALSPHKSPLAPWSMIFLSPLFFSLSSLWSQVGIFYRPSGPIAISLLSIKLLSKYG